MNVQTLTSSWAQSSSQSPERSSKAFSLRYGVLPCYSAPLLCSYYDGAAHFYRVPHPACLPLRGSPGNFHPLTPTGGRDMACAPGESEPISSRISLHLTRAGTGPGVEKRGAKPVLQ